MVRNRSTLTTVVALVLALVALSCVSGSGEIIPEVASTVEVASVASVGSVDGEVNVVRTSPVLTVSETSVVSEPETVVYRDGRGYLSDVVPPCSFGGDEDRDPCEPKEIPPIETLSSASYTFLEIDFLRTMLGGSIDFLGTHLVLRGVVQDNSTRCDYFPILFPIFASDDMKEGMSSFKYLYDYHCFVDVAVSEYIIGEGPPVMTISVNRNTITKYVIDELEKDPEELLNYPRSWTAEAYEGREIVVFLSTSITFAVETWAVTGVWFLQRTDDNLIQAVSLDRDAVPEELKDDRIMPLDELITSAKQAAEERDKLTNGRLGVATRLPLLITDAYDLREYYINAGAVYGTVEGATVLPPPVPGENDPAPPTIPIDDGTTVSSVLAPGEEPTAPPSTDDAGLQDDEATTTTTTTTTSTTTTTTATESTTSTEAVPTSEVSPTAPVDTEPVTTTITTTTTTVTTEPAVTEPASTTTTVTTEPAVTEPASTTTTATTEPAVTEPASTTTTISEPAVTASSTTTTVVSSAPGGAGGSPEPGEGLSGEEQVAPTTTAVSGGDDDPEAETATSPVEGPEEQQGNGLGESGQDLGNDG